MRTLLILVVLAAIGFGGWWWWTHRQAEVPADPFSTQPNLAPEPLPAAAAKAMAEADALWAQAGSDAATAPQAPRIARLYSEALLALYDLRGRHDDEERLVRDRLAPLGQALFFSRNRWAEDATGLIGVHVVAPGENPEAIARSYGMSNQLLNRLRGKDPDSADLRAGDTLKIVQLKQAGGQRIEIDLSDYTLDLFLGGVFAKRYIIAHGAAESPTPVGATQLTDRVWHPQWTHPTTKKVIPYGDPENILGPIWLPFDAKLLGTSGIGIHGYTGADGRMQAQVSNGCIRMQNADAEELFQLIAHPGRAPTAVVIRR
jgi:lipoprotein-anchoring transpeptidase ErfK/SrfK